MSLLRNDGWMVASHNDYPQGDATRVYWSFNRGHQFIDADGANDREALIGCLMQAKAINRFDKLRSFPGSNVPPEIVWSLVRVFAEIDRIRREEADAKPNP